MNRVIKATKLTKSEVEAINARIFFNNLKTDTLCWSCMNARDNKEHSCSKFKTGVPVEGSKYETHQGALGEEYNIRECPCFKFEYDRPQALKSVVGIIAHWCDVTTRTVWRNPKGWVAMYNKICPECQIMLADEDEDDEWDDEE
jgi:hypothetical protein